MPLLAGCLFAIVILAIGARRAAIWPTWPVIALIGLTVLPFCLSTMMLILPRYALREMSISFMLVIGPLMGVWVLVGYGLLRGFPRTARP